MATGALIGAIASSVGSYAAGVTVLGLTVAQTALLAGVSSFALSSLQSALAPSPPKLDPGSFGSVQQGVTVQGRNATATRKGVYGEAYLSGSFALQETTGTNNKYLYIVLPIADHEIDEIGEIWLDDEPITDDQIDTDGTVLTGRYANKVRIIKHLGSSTQTADTDLVADIGWWTSNHRGRDVAYVIAIYTYDREKFPTGLPNLAAWVKGKKIYDPRDAGTRWTVNPALFLRDYLTTGRDEFVPGMGISSSRLNDTDISAEANVCDEFVDTQSDDQVVADVDTTNDLLEIDAERLKFQTGDKVNIITTGTAPTGLATGTDYYVIVYQRKTNTVCGPRIALASSYANALAGTAVSITAAGTGTHTIRKVAEPRYAGGGINDTQYDHGEMLTRIARAMAGSVYRAGAQWVMKAGRYTSSVASFDEGDIVSGVTLNTKVSWEQKFNTVKGVYVSPLNDGQPADYPAWSNSTYISNDNGVTQIRDIDLHFTTRASTAQRLAKIALNVHRQEQVFEADFTMKAMTVAPGQVISLTFDALGFSSKEFEVQNWERRVSEDSEGHPVNVIHMVLQETASTLWDWSSGDEVQVDPAPNTSFPDPFTVPVVGGFSLDSILVYTQGGDKTYKVIASWEISDNQFVASGGSYELFFKRSSETDALYKSLAKVDGDVTNVQIPQLEPDVTYDIQIIAYNYLGVPSNATTITDFVVGTTVTTDTEDWESESLTAEDWETDSLTAEDWET